MHAKLAMVAQRWTWGQTALLVAVLAVGLHVLGDVSETDLYWHLLTGRDILFEHRLTGDAGLTFGPSQEWFSTQSFSEVLGYLWLKVFGLESFAAVRVVSGVVVAATVAWSVLRTSPRFSARALTYWVAAFSLFIVVLGFVPVQERSQTASFVFLPFLALIALRALYTGRFPALWVVFPFVLAWSLLHGAALLVAPLLGYIWLVRMVLSRFGLLSYGSSQPWWFGLAAAVTAAAATLVNPLGLGLYRQALHISESANIYIQEWAKPIAFGNWGGAAAPLLFGAIWLSAILVLRRHGFSYRSFLLDLSYLIPLFIYLEMANRNVAVTSILVTPMIARRVVQAFAFYPRSSVSARLPRLAFPAAVGLTVFSVVVAVVSLGHVSSVDSSVQPARIYAGLADTVGERRVINNYDISGRLQLLTQPEVRTAIDGRSDRYTPRMTVLYMRMLNAAPEWRETFVDYSTATDAVFESDAPLGDELLAEGWRLVCVDNGFSWFTAPNMSGSCPAVAGDLPVNIDR